MNPLLNRILIFDGSHALHRSMAVPSNWDMKTSYGKRTGGIFGVLRTIQKELKEYNYFPIVVFDGHLSKRRLQIHPNYKHHADNLLLESVEEKTEEQLLDEEFRREYSTQRNDLINLLTMFGIPTIRLEDWEGDDIIYILTKLSKNSIVVSDDKDLLQLIHAPTQEDNRTCRVKRAMREEFWDNNTLTQNGVNIAEYIGCKAICGDTSDNIPSACFQVGEKTALGLYKLYENCTKNNIQFPQNESELDKLCKQFDIAKRKAYLNFNENQFLINVLLTDLELVQNEISDELINNLYSYILDTYSNYNVDNINTLLNQFEIKTFDANKLLSSIISLKDMVKIEDSEKVNHICEINKPKGLLF